MHSSRPHRQTDRPTGRRRDGWVVARDERRSQVDRQHDRWRRRLAENWSDCRVVVSSSYATHFIHEIFSSVLCRICGIVKAGWCVPPLHSCWSIVSLTMTPTTVCTAHAVAFTVARTSYVIRRVTKARQRYPNLCSTQVQFLMRK